VVGLSSVLLFVGRELDVELCGGGDVWGTTRASEACAVGFRGGSCCRGDVLSAVARLVFSSEGLVVEGASPLGLLALAVSTGAGAGAGI